MIGRSMANGDDNHHSPGLTTLLGRLARTGLGALRNRVELLAVEWAEERLRMMQVLSWAVGFILAGGLAALLLTATIIFLFHEELRIYVAAGFTVLYALCALGAWVRLRMLLKQEPFAETVDQANKDRAWIDSLK
ncbi:MAG TPA: phage holin family protein [Verrucomicrobiae bacterium]|nr:phage holin family protein [Verrucomicrobiae bacterium]